MTNTQNPENPTMDTITLEITVWDAAKVEALLRKIEADSRVVTVTRLDAR